MAKVSVTVNGRSYLIGCDDGEEDRLQELASYLDRHVSSLSGTMGGEAGDSRLLLMAGLLVADELSDTLSRLDEIEAELNAVKIQRDAETSRAQKTEEQARKLVETASSRMASIAGRLQPT